MRLRFNKPRPLNRQDGAYRDSRLFVIATEDTHAPKHYFEENFRSPRIHVVTLTTKDGLSSPDHVIRRIDEYREEFELKDGDVLWLMLDTDHWVKANHVKNFDRVCREAGQKNYQLAHSNPCFEIWLLLHLEDIAADQEFRRSDDVIRRLKRKLGGYDKGSRATIRFPSKAIAAAVARAKKLDTSPTERWPQKPGTHVYKIVEKLLSGSLPNQAE
jgi:hypothetical protein